MLILNQNWFVFPLCKEQIVLQPPRESLASLSEGKRNVMRLGDGAAGMQEDRMKREDDLCLCAASNFHQEC